MKKYLSASLLLVSFSITGQTLSINPAGTVRLSPQPERTAELYASANPRGGPWEFVTEFAAVAQVPTTNQTKFYRARVKAPPAKLIAILATNQTIRGSIDKLGTNYLLIVNGQTNEGWSFGSKGRLPGPGEGRMPITTRSDFSFPCIPVTNTTPAELLIWDEDGYLLRTNLFIGPGPYVPLRPKGYEATTNALAPASSEYDLQHSTWVRLTSHSAIENLDGILVSGNCAGEHSSSFFSGSWDGEKSSLAIGQNWCKRGQIRACNATYESATGNSLLMHLLEETDDRDCVIYPSVQAYAARAEFGDYNSDTDDAEISSVFTRGCNSRAEMWVGGQQMGSVSNYWVRVEIGLNQAVERIGGSEVLFGPAPSWIVGAIGGRPTRSDGASYYPVPPEGRLIDVTPSLPRLGGGWFHYQVATGFTLPIERTE